MFGAGALVHPRRGHIPLRDALPTCRGGALEGVQRQGDAFTFDVDRDDHD